MKDRRSNGAPCRQVQLYILSIVTVLVVASAAIGLRIIESIRSPLVAETYVEMAATPDLPRPQGGGIRSPLRFAVAPIVSPGKAVRAYRELADFLAKGLGREVDLQQCLTYGEANELMRNRSCELAFVCTYAFVRGERDFGMQALAIPLIRGVTTYRSFVVVPKTSAALTFLELRGKRFASADLMSSSGWLFPATWLLNKGFEPESFFADLLITRSHDQSIKAVASGHADAAGVVSVIYEQLLDETPELRDSLRVVLASPPFGMPPVVCHPKIDPAFRNLLVRLLVQMDQDQEGRRILASLKFDRFVIPDRKDHDSVRAMVTAWESR